MSDKEAWQRRFNRAGAAQSKYLWTLFVLGFFCWVIASPSTVPSGPAGGPVSVPLVNVPLSPAAVLVISPAAIFFVQIVIFNALRALSTAEEALKPHGIDETTDEHYNAIDWAVYTTKKSPLWIQRLAWFAYPLYMLVFTAEAIYFLYRAALPAVNVSGRWILVGIAVIEGAIVLIFTYGFWAGRVRRLNAEVTGLKLP